MMGNRVRELRLAVRAAPGDDMAVLSRGERFTRRVLERAAMMIEERAPGRLVAVRRLPLRWRLADGTLDTPAAELRCAEAVAEALLAVPLATGPDALGAEAAAFEDAAHWWALRLEARARGLEARVAAGVLEDDAVTALCAPACAGDLLIALERLARTGVLDQTLGGLADDDVSRLAAAAHRAAGLESTDRRAGDDLDAASAATTSRAVGAGATQARHTVAALATARLGPRPRPSVQAALAARPRPRVELAADEPPLRLPLESRFGGIAYLVALALELEIGELLWTTCLSEGPWLALALGALVGADGEADPIVAAVAGTTVREAKAHAIVSPEQQRTIALALFEAMRDAFPRRALAELPLLTLSLTDAAASRVLLATPVHYPFAVFAVPVTDGSATADALRALLARWPLRAERPLASRALGRLVPERVDTSGGDIDHGVLSPSLESPDACALVAQIAGTLAALFAARAGAPSPDAASLRARWWEVPATIDDDGARLTITLPGERIDLALRRAGLDRSPGWVPWLRRFVRIEFVGAALEEAE